eukprot:1341382-Pleurochrysis_carterae.AAC.3
MSYEKAQIIHGQREGLLRHHGSGAGTACPQAYRLLRVRPRNQRDPAHAWKVKAVATATTDRISHTTDRFGQV